ncbi:hypothetical protein [Caryophanon latum]|uniref:Uncharacterized protein n=1 Tax=Caryophanon latum TaxID=33977 RepID=A0A1C0YUJ3_9BACL|nr:hypothetical protein [Caryophanon latum]OCS90813.1 hypothetical protein A6K76_01825 [Caryophanon latum]
MTLNERLRELSQLKATDDQQRRIYERVTNKRPKRPKQWKPLAAMCSIVLILLFLTYVESGEKTTLQSDPLFVAHMTQLKDDFSFPVTYYTNVTPYELRIVRNAIQDIISGKREPIARVDDDLDIVGFEQSPSYVYAEYAGETYLFEHDYMALYDRQNDVSYALTEDEDAWLNAPFKELPTYFVVGFVVTMVWNGALPYYCKRTGREQKGIKHAPKQWQGIFYLMMTVSIIFMFTIMFTEIVVFKGYLLALLLIDAVLALYMGRFINGDRFDIVTHYISVLLGLTMAVLLLMQL